jgi:hypothetical protein
MAFAEEGGVSGDKKPFENILGILNYDTALQRLFSVHDAVVFGGSLERQQKFFELLQADLTKIDESIEKGDTGNIKIHNTRSALLDRAISFYFYLYNDTLDFSLIRDSYRKLCNAMENHMSNANRLQGNLRNARNGM